MATATAIPDETSAKIIDAVRKVSAIASLPEVTFQIITTVEDPNSSASQLHKIVCHDPSLVTRILKVVNSAFYGLPGQISSIERAIVLLGLNAVKNIAVAASLGQLFSSARLCEGFGPKDLWKHCIAVGVTARDLAQQMKLPYLEEAFLGGMIHDVGLIVGLQEFPTQFRSVCQEARRTGREFCQIERELIGADHQQLGAALAEQWKFPRLCQLVTDYHHRPMALAEEYRVLPTLVYVADTICCQQNYGFNLTGTHQNLLDSGMDHIHLEKAMIERTISRLDELVAIASDILSPVPADQ